MLLRDDCLLGHCGRFACFAPTNLDELQCSHTNFRTQAPHDETGERMFTIMGTAKANESALFLLYENLEAEKMRRSQQQSPE